MHNNGASTICKCTRDISRVSYCVYSIVVAIYCAYIFQQSTSHIFLFNVVPISLSRDADADTQAKASFKDCLNLLCHVSLYRVTVRTVGIFPASPTSMAPLGDVGSAGERRVILLYTILLNMNKIIFTVILCTENYLI